MLSVIKRKLTLKIAVVIGALLLFCILAWSIFTIAFEEKVAREILVGEADRLSQAVVLSTHYAMLHNAREDIREIVGNMGRMSEVRQLRIYNKRGQVKFSTVPAEVDTLGDKAQPVCQACHKYAHPPAKRDIEQRVFLGVTPDGENQLNVITPILSEPSCVTAACHFHPANEPILGVLTLGMAYSQADRLVHGLTTNTVTLAAGLFLATFAALFVLLVVLVTRPVQRLIASTREISEGRAVSEANMPKDDEMGELAEAIKVMGAAVRQKQLELTLQKEEYQRLFELVPCLVTVQNSQFRLVSFNQSFADHFQARPGDYCYKAYKNRDSKCPNCPVEKTFADGKSHTAEEEGVYKDGTPAYWMVTTSPICDDQGQVAAVMELCLDITPRKRLEEELVQSERKYHDIFYNMSEGVFVVDKEELTIRDCNKGAERIYGYDRSEMAGRSFLDLFPEQERPEAREKLVAGQDFKQAAQLAKDGRTLYAHLRLAPSDHHGEKVLLVVASDITQRLESEQQLIQASKMATLGEMATGVAHELNQPLSVIQSSVDFLMRKMGQRQRIDDETLKTVAELIGSHMTRAGKIIGHMREFGRKADFKKEQVNLNDVLKRACEFFAQQLTLRDIAVVWDLQEDLPLIQAEPNQLEQVFVNLLVNARDAIEERSEPHLDGRKITLQTRAGRRWLTVRVCDTGVGMSKAVAAKVFEPFYTTKPSGKGTGLGLSISYGIVRNHGGDIGVQSEKGQGACFFVHFPLGDQAQAG